MPGRGVYRDRTPVANPAPQDGTRVLAYLAIGAKPPAEVGTYADSGAPVIDALGRHQFLRVADYDEGSLDPRRCRRVRATR